MNTYRIAYSSNTSGFNIIGKWAKVEKELFDALLDNQLKLITQKQPDMYDELRLRVRQKLTEAPCSIGNIIFEIIPLKVR